MNITKWYKWRATGITFVNGTNVYLNQTTGVSGTSSVANALCDEGDFVLNGGFVLSRTDDDPNASISVTYNRPTTGVPPDLSTSASAGAGWEAGVFTESPSIGWKISPFILIILIFST